MKCFCFTSCVVKAQRLGNCGCATFDPSMLPEDCSHLHMITSQSSCLEMNIGGVIYDFYIIFMGEFLNGCGH